MQLGRNAARAYGYESSTGTTTGGITDAFASFWYFGCLEFFAVAYFMRRLYESAVRGSPVWQFACALMTVYALHTVTHCTTWFVLPWVNAAIFVVPALVYARVRPGEGNREIISAIQLPRSTRAPSGMQLSAWNGAGKSRIERNILARPKIKRRILARGTGWRGLGRLPTLRRSQLGRSTWNGRRPS